MLFFTVFLFFLIGLLASIYSYFLLLLLIPLSAYLFLFKKKKKEIVIGLAVTLLAVLIILLFPKYSGQFENHLGLVIRKKDNYFLLWTIKGTYYVYEKENSLGLFSIVSFSGQAEELSLNHYESGFSFKDYLKTQGTFNQLYIKTKNVIFNTNFNFKFIKDYSYSYLNDDSRNIADSLLFGESLDSSSYGYISELGISSMLAVSGFHLTFLFGNIQKWIKKKYQKDCNLIFLIFLVFFLFLSSFRYTIRRLFLLYLLKEINLHSKHRLSSLNLLSINALIMLIIEPYSLLSPSFYYSFPFLFYLRIFSKNKSEGLKSSLEFLGLLLLFFFPFRLYTQYGLYPLGILLQVLLIPLSHLIFLFSILVILLPFVGIILNTLVFSFLFLANEASKIHLFLPSGMPSLILTIIFYSLLLMIMILKNYNFKKESQGLLIILSFIFSLNFVPDFLPHYEVSAIDVNQGSATLIRYGKENILIDTGGEVKNDLAKNCLIPYFHKRKITGLNGVIISHLDYDHYGALASLKENFPINNIYYSSDYSDKENNVISFEEFQMTNLNTFQLSSDTNSTSGVYDFSIKDVKILVMGDAPITIEKKIISSYPETTADLLILGHHGSKTSSCLEFLDYVQPKTAIISCGEDNSYGFPNKEVLSNLNYLSIPYRRTDEEGTITFDLTFGL
ncbi:MAG: ComEC/Rec2 family competence protein [Bacilli bacterium]